MRKVIDKIIFKFREAFLTVDHEKDISEKCDEQQYQNNGRNYQPEGSSTSNSFHTKSNPISKDAAFYDCTAKVCKANV